MKRKPYEILSDIVEQIPFSFSKPEKVSEEKKPETTCQKYVEPVTDVFVRFKNRFTNLISSLKKQGEK